MRKYGGEHTKPTLSAAQRKNLEKLALFLQKLPKKSFDMEFYRVKFTIDADGDVVEEQQFQPRQWKCGSVGCAIGWGPAAGISIPKDVTNWISYSNRQLGANEDDVWLWCFDADWVGRNSTPKGAARRILYILEHGVPPVYQWDHFFSKG